MDMSQVLLCNNYGWYLCGDEKCASHLSPIMELLRLAHLQSVDTEAVGMF